MSRSPKVPNNDAFRAFWEGGLTLDDIGQCYGVTRVAISRAAKRFGYPPRHVQAKPRRRIPVPQPKPVPADASVSGRMPPEEHRLTLAHERGDLPALDLWPLDRDMALLRCRGRYEPMSALARDWDMPYSRLLARWHLLRVL